jgi:hypothetical protein
MNSLPTAQAMLETFQQHMTAEMTGDIEATMATMTDDPHVNHVPVIVNGIVFGNPAVADPEQVNVARSEAPARRRELGRQSAVGRVVDDERPMLAAVECHIGRDSISIHDHFVELEAHVGRCSALTFVGSFQRLASRYRKGRQMINEVEQAVEAR